MTISIFDKVLIVVAILLVIGGIFGYCHFKCIEYLYFEDGLDDDEDEEEE